MTRDEISSASTVMHKHSIEPENTRLHKHTKHQNIMYELLQASAETSTLKLEECFQLVQGDHSQEMLSICAALMAAKKYVANDKQDRVLSGYIECFQTGSMSAYRASQKAWVTDKSARVENVLGFVEPYRDPFGVRAEWEGLVGIADPSETAVLKRFVERSSTFIRELPWVVEAENNKKGPFENNSFEPPDFTSVHGWLHFKYLRLCYLLSQLLHSVRVTSGRLQIYRM